MSRGRFLPIRPRQKTLWWFIAGAVILGALTFRILKTQSAFEPSRPAPKLALAVVDPYLKLPLPDPESDVLFGSDAAHISIVRYSPAKGFWAREDEISASIGSGLHVDEAHGHFLFATSLFPAAVIAVDLQSARPWAAASVIEIGGTAYGSTFDEIRHRYFVLASGKVYAIRAVGKIINSVSVNVNANAIAVDSSGRFLFTCPGQVATSCREFDVDAATGAMSPHLGRELVLPAAPGPLTPAVDGQYLLIPGIKPGVHQRPEYRLNASGKLAPVPGTGQEIADTGYLWVYRIELDGKLTPVPDAPFRMQHACLSIIPSPNGRFLYVDSGTEGESGIDVYSFDLDSGKIYFLPDAIGPNKIAGSEVPTRIFFGRSEERAYARTRNMQVLAYDANPQTGHLALRTTGSLWPRLNFVLSAEPFVANK